MRLIPILATSCFVSSMSMRVIDPVVPEMARDLGVMAAIVAMLASAFTFPYALGQPVLGALGDALGKVRIIKISLTVLMVSLFVTAVAQSITVIYAARIVGGAAAGGIIPLAFAMVGDRIPYADRQVALSRLLAAIISGQLTGSIGSGVVADYAGWRVALAGGAALSLVALMLTMAFLRPRVAAVRDPFSTRTAIAGYRLVLANPQSWVCFPAVFVEGVVLFGLFPYIALLLEQRGAGGVREAGFVLAGFGIGGLVYAALVARVLPRLGVFKLMITGSVVAGLALAGLTVGASWPVECAIFIAVGVGFYMVHNSLQTIATELSVTNRGASVAAHAFFFFLGQAAGPIIYGAALARLGPFVTLILAGALFATAGLAAAYGLRMVARYQR